MPSFPYRYMPIRLLRSSHSLQLCPTVRMIWQRHCLSHRQVQQVINGKEWFSVKQAVVNLLAAGAIASSYTPLTSTPGEADLYCVVTNVNNCSTTSNVSGAVIISPAIADNTVVSSPASVCSNTAPATLTGRISFRWSRNWKLHI